MATHFLAWNVGGKTHCKPHPDSAAAQAGYDDLGLRYAKCIVAPGGGVVVKFGIMPYVQQCVDAAQKAAAAAPAVHGVVYRVRGQVYRYTTYSDHGSAKAAFDLVQRGHAACLVVQPGSVVLEQHGNAGNIRRCKAAIEGAVVTDVVVGDAHVVAWRTGGQRYQCMAFVGHKEAKKVYDAVEMGHAACLVAQGSGGVVERHGNAKNAGKCVELAKAKAGEGAGVEEKRKEADAAEKAKAETAKARLAQEAKELAMEKAEKAEKAKREAEKAAEEARKMADAKTASELKAQAEAREKARAEAAARAEAEAAARAEAEMEEAREKAEADKACKIKAAALAAAVAKKAAAAAKAAQAEKAAAQAAQAEEAAKKKAQADADAQERADAEARAKVKEAEDAARADKEAAAEVGAADEAAAKAKAETDIAKAFRAADSPRFMTPLQTLTAVRCARLNLAVLLGAALGAWGVTGVVALLAYLLVIVFAPGYGVEAVLGIDEDELEPAGSLQTEGVVLSFGLFTFSWALMYSSS